MTTIAYRYPPLALCIALSLCAACQARDSDKEDASAYDAESVDSRTDGGTDATVSGDVDAGSDAATGETGSSDACCDAGRDDVSPDGAEVGADDAGGIALPAGTAVFSVTENGVVQTYDWSVDRGNHVRCTVKSPMSMIRLAVTAVRDGEADLHMDFDVCHLSGDGGTLEARDPFTTACDASSYFDVWWHKENGNGVFVNNSASSPCTLTLVREAGVLQGRFRCDRLALPYVFEPTLDVEGAFACPTGP